MFQSTRPYALEAGIPDPVICYQGAVVAEPDSGRFLRHEPVPLGLAKEAIAAVEGDGFPVNGYVDDELYVSRPTPESELYAESRDVESHAVGDLGEWLVSPPTKLVAMGEPGALDGLADRLRVRFDGRLAIAKSLPWLVELSSPTATKGEALIFLAEHLGFSLERTVAFGDGENDLELFRRAAYGVAVENADVKLLEQADLVCAPADREGVAEVLDAYLDSLA